MFKWSKKAQKSKKWNVKLFHSDSSNCIRENAITGPLPPYGYYPCEKCFPAAMRHKLEWLLDSNILERRKNTTLE